MRSNGSAGGLRALGYVRVSTEEQAREGVSLDAQRQSIEAHAEAQGWELVGVEADKGISGKRTANRPGLHRALRALKGRKADALLMVALDRLSRTTTDVLGLASRAEREGWRILCVNEQVDATPEGEFMLTLRAGLAQLERRKVAERTRVALSELWRQGRRTSRHAPFGYAWKDGRRVRVESEQRLLCRMLALRAQGLGKKRIARSLNRAGRINPRTGRPWNYGTVAAILRTVRRHAAGTSGAGALAGAVRQ